MGHSLLPELQLLSAPRGPLPPLLQCQRWTLRWHLQLPQFSTTLMSSSSNSLQEEPCCMTTTM